MRRLAVTFVVLLALAPRPGRAETRQTLHASVFSPLATSADPEVAASVRLSALWSRAGRVSGLDLGLGATCLSGDLRGLQLTLLHAQVNGGVHGLMATPGLALSRAELYGVQFGGLTAYHLGDLGGFQASNAFAYTRGRLHGGQLSSVLGQIDGHLCGVQVAGAACLSAGEVTGVQLASGLNLAVDGVTGLQAALVNWSGALAGVQVGVVNAAGEARGLQVGLVDVSTTQQGLPMGLVVWADDNGGADWITTASSHLLASTGVRTFAGSWYTELEVGLGDRLGDVRKAAALGWHWGRQFHLSSGWFLDADVGLLHVIPEASDDPAERDRLYPASQMRLALERRLNPRIAIRAGAGLAVTADDYDADTSANHLHVFAGLALY